jgi:hypothetical protein
MRFLTAVACAAMLAGCKVEADFSGALPTETLQAETYQSEIASIDRLLFRETPLGDDGVRTLKRILTALADRVGAAKAGSKFLKIESLELRLLAERAGGLSPDRTGRPLQNDWMRIRNNLFDDRAWFVRSAADLEYAAKVVPPPATIPAPATILTPQPFEAAPIEHSSTLTGRWQATAMLANGKASDDRELIGSIWTFDPPRLIVRDGTGHETAYNCVVQGEYLALTTPRGEDGWMKYEVDAEGLRLGFYDGLKGKPTSFEAEPRRNDPLLVVVRLVAMR